MSLSTNVRPKKTILLIIADYTNLHNHVERPQKKCAHHTANLGFSLWISSTNHVTFHSKRYLPFFTPQVTYVFLVKK